MSGGPLCIESEFISEEEYKEREKKIRKAMEERKLDLLLLYGDEYRYGDSLYVSNYKGGNLVDEAPYCVFFPLDESKELVFFAGRFNVQTAKDYARIKDVRCAWDIDKELKDLAQGKRYRRVGFSGEDIMPQSIYERIRKGLPDATLEPASDIMRDLRMRKSDGEIRLMRRAAELADMGLKAAEDALRPGRACWELIGIAEHAVRMNGGDNLFFNVVASAERTGDWITAPTPGVVKEGNLFMLGLHPNYKFYYNDTERNWAVGKVPKEQEEVLKAGGRVMKGLIAYAKPGITYKDLYDKEGDLWKEEGYADYWFPYAEKALGKALGHGIGLAVVEWPVNYPQDWDIVLEPNMTLAIKSELHGFKWGGLRHETVILITKEGAEPLNKFHYPLVD